MSSSDDNHTRLDSASSTAVIPRQGTSPDDQPGAVQLCMCGCGQQCRSRYIRGHNLRKDSRRKPRPDTRPDISPVIQPDFDFAQSVWIDDTPGKPPVLNHDGNGTEILSPCVKITGAGYFHLTDSLIESLTSAVKFCSAVLCEESGSLILDDNGRARWHILKLGRNPAIIWESVTEKSIEVCATYEAFEISPGRILHPLEWSRYVTIKITNKGGFTRVREIASMDFEQQRARSGWIDALDVSVSGRVTEIKNYIRCQRSMIGDTGIAIYGQGPIFHDGTYLFVSRSAAFDAHGIVRDDIRVDLSGLPDAYAYYDMTPPGQISDDQIKLGCEELISAYAESPKHPEISAAFLGQLFTVSIVAIDPRFFSALFLSGDKGSGKTYLAVRYDSVQSRTLRGDLKSIQPVLNLGDTTGTVKGPKYRVAEYAGFAITTDDVIKSGDSAAHIALQSDIVSNLIRSFESGGAALGRVDRARNRVVSGQSGALHASIKLTSEKPIIGDSTLDRMIMLPHLMGDWKNGGIFDTGLAEKLSTPGSREIQHLAWSAFSYWLFQRIDTVLNDCYREAQTEANTWNVSPRMALRYAALVSGHYAFSRFCAERGIDASEAVTRAVTALRECARRQAQSSVPLAIHFRLRMRQMLSDGRISLTGRGIADPDGSPGGNFSDPRLAVEVEQDDGTKTVVRTMPPGIQTFDDLGLIMQGQTWAPNPRATRYGYIIPPRDGKGAQAGSQRRQEWTVAIPVQNFDNLCHTLTEYSKTRGGQSFRPEDVITSLEQIKMGSRERVRVLYNADPKVKINQSRVIEIDQRWLFASGESEE